MIKYITPFITAFLLSIFFVMAAIYLAGKVNWHGRKAERHIHLNGRKNVFRTGGVAIILAFNLAILLNKDLFIPVELYGVMAGTLLLLIIGVWDDFHEISWRIQLFFQVAVAIMVFILGVRIYNITNPIFGGAIGLSSGLGTLFSAILVIIWLVLVINSMNWLDGIDGLSGGITLIGSLTIFFLSLKPEVNQPPVAILAMILAGSVLGFLVFNFNPSRILAGTSGSMFMGFSLAVLAIFSGTKIATALLVLALPIIDLVWVIGERIRQKKSIFKPDRNHLHYKLLELGWSQSKINALFYFITLIMAAIALNTRILGKSITFLAATLLLVLALAVINNKTKRSSI